MDNVIQFPREHGAAHVVLLVDDEPAIRGVLSEFLQSCGYQTITAFDADDALNVLRSERSIDLVFSDIHMPGSMDGFSLARWIMENKPGLPIILVSGDLGKTNASVELFGAEIMPKPYVLDVAARKIRAALDCNGR